MQALQWAIDEWYLQRRVILWSSRQLGSSIRTPRIWLVWNYCKYRPYSFVIFYSLSPSIMPSFVWKQNPVGLVHMVCVYDFALRSMRTPRWHLRFDMCHADPKVICLVIHRAIPWGPVGPAVNVLLLCAWFEYAFQLFIIFMSFGYYLYYNNSISQINYKLNYRLRVHASGCQLPRLVYSVNCRDGVKQANELLSSFMEQHIVLQHRPIISTNFREDWESCSDYSGRVCWRLRVVCSRWL